MSGARSKAAAVVLAFAFAIFAGGGNFWKNSQQLHRLQEENAELKRKIESMRERLELEPQPILCAGTFSSGCGNGPRPKSPWAY